MLQPSPVPLFTAPREGMPFLCIPPFQCTLTVGGRRAAWVHVAGELDLLTSPQLESILAEARLSARMTVLDAREVTFIDCSGIHTIHDASKACEHDAGRLMVVSSAAIERILDLTDLRDEISTFDLSPDEPDPALRLVSAA